MSPIKLKAYLKAHNETVLVDNIDFIEKEITVIDEYGRDYYFPFDEIVLLQYTGLKDKNGKEICEGDVIYHHHRDKEYRIQGIVRYEEKWAGFYFAENRGMNTTTTYEVIGNIYENPELLEKPNAN